MRLKPLAMLMPALLIAAATLPLSAQATYSAERGAWPIVVGAGYSSIDMDWGHDAQGNRRIVNGITGWVDWTSLPRMPRGLGLEFEGEHINWNQPPALPQFRIDAGLAGPIYTWQRFRRFRPYGRAMIGFGGIHFPPFGQYSHDTRVIYAPGFGAKYRAWNNIWLRADYEYQFWPNMFSQKHTLNPRGFTLGMAYDFRGLHRKY